MWHWGWIGFFGDKYMAGVCKENILNLIVDKTLKTHEMLEKEIEKENSKTALTFSNSIPKK